MSLLREARVEQAAAKVGIFGRQGSGKSTTGVLIAVGLSKAYHQNAPVAMLDTENGSDYLKAICDAEGVPFVVAKSRAFKDMQAALREAEEQKCCVYMVDSYTHPWQELTASFKAKSKRKRLEFYHMDELKTLWRGWTDQMLNSPLHIILSGRLGFEWGEEETDDGRNLIKLGTKMKSESEAGYEPSLLIEMEGLQDADVRLKKTRTKRGSIMHHCYVLKDRWRALNGRTFQFADINEYKPGDYKKVFTAFQPHWSKLVIGGAQRAVDASRTSESLFNSAGENIFQEMTRRKEIACEEIEGALVALWPGQDAKSKEMKRAAVDALFQSRSWTAIRAKPVEELEAGRETVKLFEEAVKHGGHQATTEVDACTALIQMCQERVITLARERDEATVF